MLQSQDLLVVQSQLRDPGEPLKAFLLYMLQSKDLLVGAGSVRETLEIPLKAFLGRK
jgi:hypothetical protein